MEEKKSIMRPQTIEATVCGFAILGGLIMFIIGIIRTVTPTGIDYDYPYVEDGIFAVTRYVTVSEMIAGTLFIVIGLLIVAIAAINASKIRGKYADKSNDN